jgi:hypothetical protein
MGGCEPQRIGSQFRHYAPGFLWAFGAFAGGFTQLLLLRVCPIIARGNPSFWWCVEQW